MTPSEWKIVKRLATFVFIVALFPIGAFVYRFILNPDSADAGSPLAIPALSTLVPGSNEFTFATPAPTSLVVVVPSGWSEHVVADQNFAISLPTRWQRLPVNPQELEASLQVIRESNPELAAALGTSGQQLIQSGVKFWAFDLDAASLKSKFATNLTVTRQTLPNQVSFDAYALVNLNQVNALSSRQGELTHERIAMANLPAEKIHYNLLFRAGDGSSVTSAISQYLLLNGNDAYVLTYATRLDELTKYAATFDQSALSFRLLGQ